MNNKYNILLNVLDTLRKEAPQEYKKYHPLDSEKEKLNQARSRAYIHLFLKVKFGLLDFLERENYVTDESQDGGIDAYYIDSQNKEIYFIQSKFRITQKNFESKDIALEEILSMDIDRITDGEDSDENGIKYNNKILKFIREISSIDDIGKYTYKAIILANLKNKIKPSQIKKLTGGFAGEVYNFERCYNELLFPLITGTFYNVTELFISLNLSQKTSDEISYSVTTAYGKCDITVVFVPIIEIAKIMYKYKNSILKFNPRSYLDLKGNSVNQAISDTVKNNNTNEFALFNNGITMLSDNTNINKKIGKKDQAQMIVVNPQIINGGQTAFTLSKLYQETLINGDQDNIFANKEVILKIITFSEDESMSEKKKRKLIEEISKATNQQSPVVEADRRSNDDIQIELQEKIFNTFGYFYERKKGEYGDGLHNKYIDRSKIIDRVQFIRICLAIKGDVSNARRSGETILFRHNRFKQILENSSQYKKYFFAFISMKHLNIIQQEFKDNLNNRDGIANYGYSLRYGKYSVISVISNYYNDSFINEEYEEKVQFIINQVLNKWLEFEDYIINEKHNFSYFREIINPETQEIRKMLDYDGYYKGRTINKDINTFFKEFELTS
ncbi:MAG TPA: AIPR protein [Bacteroidia bacterium]|nr:AIPR protein [Bacteroidia bacterium]